MTLDEFMVELRMTADVFQWQWLEHHKLDPDVWPLDMDAGDWYETFMQFDPESDKD